MTSSIHESRLAAHGVSSRGIPSTVTNHPMTHTAVDWKAVGKWAVGSVAVGMDRTFGRRSADGLGVLVYHRIAPVVRGLPAPTMNVTPAMFRHQLEGLLERGFQIWPLRRALSHSAQGRAFPLRTVVVTFDDGFENVFLNAWPILRDLDVPATIFVTTAFLDADRFPFDAWGYRWGQSTDSSTYRPLRTAQCRDMLDGGLIEIGAHTHTHADFRGRPEGFEADLRTSVSRLDTQFGVRAPTFAFPFGRPHLGYVSPALVAAARRTNVTCGLTTKNEVVPIGSDPFDWGRFNAFDSDTAATLAAKLDGWYGWAPSVHEWLVKGRRRLRNAKT